MKQKEQSHEDYLEIYRPLIEHAANVFGEIVESGNIHACAWLSMHVWYIAREASFDLGLLKRDSEGLIH